MFSNVGYKLPRPKEAEPSCFVNVNVYFKLKKFLKAITIILK